VTYTGFTKIFSEFPATSTFNAGKKAWRAVTGEELQWYDYLTSWILSIDSTTAFLNQDDPTAVAPRELASWTNTFTDLPQLIRITCDSQTPLTTPTSSPTPPPIITTIPCDQLCIVNGMAAVESCYTKQPTLFYGRPQWQSNAGVIIHFFEPLQNWMIVSQGAEFYTPDTVPSAGEPPTSAVWTDFLTGATFTLDITCGLATVQPSPSPTNDPGKRQRRRKIGRDQERRRRRRRDIQKERQTKRERERERDDF